MRTITHSVALLLAAAVGACAATEPAAPTNAATPAPSKSFVSETNLFPDTVIASGKGLEIKRSQLDDEVVRIKSTMAARGQVVPAEQLPMIEQGVLDRLIEMQLLLNQANEADKTKAQADAAKRFEEIRTNAVSDEMLDRQLKMNKLTRADLIRKIAEESTVQNALERLLKVNATDADAKKFYDENPSKFEEPEMVRASHILISTRDAASNTELTGDQKTAKRKLAEDLLKRARAGEDFAKLAQEYSDDPGSKTRGGEYKFRRGEMVPEFEAAAFALKTNEISDIVTTQYGYHIIKLSEKIPAQKVALSEASPRIKEFLSNEQVREKAPAFFAQLKKDNNVQILDPKLKLPEDPFALPAGGAAAAADTNAAPATGSSTNK